MSPSVAFGILTWLAILVLYLALSAVLREVRLLRRQVSRLQLLTASPSTSATSATGDSAGPVAAGEQRRHTGLTLPPIAAGQGGPVLAATSDCPLCRIAIDRLSRWAVATGQPATLLTWETEAAWGALPPGVRAVRDRDAWSEIAHIDPPLLLDVADDGVVRDVILPATGADVDAALSRWSAPRPADSKDIR